MRKMQKRVCLGYVYLKPPGVKFVSETTNMPSQSFRHAFAAVPHAHTCTILVGANSNDAAVHSWPPRPGVHSCIVGVALNSIVRVCACCRTSAQRRKLVVEPVAQLVSGTKVFDEWQQLGSERVDSNVGWERWLGGWVSCGYGGSKANNPIRTIANDESQANDPKRKFPRERFQTQGPACKQKFPSQGPKRKFPSGRSETKDAKRAHSNRKLWSANSQVTVPMLQASSDIF